MGTKTKNSNQPLRVSDLVGSLSRKAPFDFAEDWDNVGFLAGNPADLVTGIIVAVNLGPEALKAAQESSANVVVCHHPPIFKPISKLTASSSPYLYEAVRAGLSVIALHTNFDLASQELSKNLAERLGLRFMDYVAPRGAPDAPNSIRQGKFVTYVPAEHLDRVREAVCSVGAGNIGNYSQCSFSWDGEGTFFGNQDSDPTVGKAGQLERVAEKRFEIVFPWRLLDRVIQAARAAHPYEEMAYDVIELAQPAQRLGYGFVAEVAPPQRKDADQGQTFPSNFTFHKLLDSVKQAFQLNSVLVAGPGLAKPDMQVRRIAFSPGSGSAFVKAASSKGADVYICGEVGYHQMLEARQKGVTLLLLGHSYSERFFVETVSDWCKELAPVKMVFEIVHENL